MWIKCGVVQSSPLRTSPLNNMNNCLKEKLLTKLENCLILIKAYKKEHSKEKRKELMRNNFHSFHKTSRYHRLIGEADGIAKRIVALTE